ncbi:MAG: ABC transporter ATP-binding protein [Halobacteriales archaeon SW_9_67_24]|jgi:branched-chain amino acid transport system ATP-binding protein|nr:MAG: ABC transporter ATP-binding protein [Halobacteriales archaeon SW_9_67_24]
MGILQVSDLVTGYGEAEIVHGVDLDIEREEMVAIIGPNGAGKSTLMRAVFGLIDCWGGSVVVAGVDVTDHRPDEITKVGASYVPQRNNVFPNLTVRENLEMGAYIDDEAPESAYEAVYERFPILEERRNQKVGRMSGGQRQMVAMGAGLMIDPDLLLVDEPSAGLAPDLVDEMFERIQRIKEGGTSILMVEQNARQALRYADRGYVLDQGENAFEGPGEELLESDEIAEMYLGQAG